ncbi:MAG: type II toxin-antitoxin system RelE/ParE family toxin [Bdellovibrionaceae bacterium]|nr:type II toxin-antitoxin system RelE/ParE family toxin [Pseudobdellovibrionaceae bacterium]
MKVIFWEGDSKEVLSSFPEAVRRDFGFDLYALQLGERPSDWRPMKSIGKGVYELRQQDSRSWYRVIYLTAVADRIHVLHCFEKRSAKTAKRDLDLARRRLKTVSARMRNSNEDK